MATWPPEGHAQPCIASLGQLLAAALHARLALGQIEAAIFEELPVMGEAPDVAGFGRIVNAMMGPMPGRLCR